MLRPLLRWLRLGVALAWCMLMLLPLLWSVLGALLPVDAPPPLALRVPEAATLLNFVRVLQDVALARQLLNSIGVTAVGALLGMLVATLAGFALSQLPVRPQRSVLALFVITALIPAGAIWLGRFLVLRGLGLMNSHAALVAYGLLGGTPATLLLCWVAARRLPVDVLDSARIDGASPLQLWWRIALPMMRAAAAATLALAALAFWSDSITPALVLKSPALYTWPVGLAQLQQLERSKWPLLMAACVWVTLPALLGLLAAQRGLAQVDVE